MRLVRLRPDDVAAAIAIEGVSGSTRKLLGRDLPRAGHLWAGILSPLAEGGSGRMATPTGQERVGIRPDQRTPVSGLEGGRWGVVGDDGDDAGRLVAVAGAIDGAGDAHVVEVAVTPDHRRAGLATRLVTALLAACRDELGSTAATLEVRASNQAAQALYRRVGFAAAGTRPGYYDPEPGGDAEHAGARGAERSGHARREDAIVMWRHDLTDLAPGWGSG